MVAAMVEGRLDEVDQVGPADLRAMRGRELRGQQFLQAAEIARRPLTGLLLAQARSESTKNMSGTW